MKTKLAPYRIDRKHPFSPPMEPRPATRPLATLGNGRKVTRWACKLTFGEACAIPGATLDTWLDVDSRTKWAVVIAASAVEANDLLRQEHASVPCLEIEVMGPQGGVAHHSYRGWESAIGATLLSARPSHKQQPLF